MKKVSYDMCYAAQFSPRPGTAAFKMKDNVLVAEKKRREDELEKVLRATALKNGQKFLNREVVVLSESRNNKGNWVGKNGQNKTVVFSAPEGKNLLGKFVLVKIRRIRDFGFDGEFVR
jgi:tRNA-2-methylthio-N6-dimethylallyladenosine synthase